MDECCDLDDWIVSCAVQSAPVVNVVRCRITVRTNLWIDRIDPVYDPWFKRCVQPNAPPMVI